MSHHTARPWRPQPRGAWSCPNGRRPCHPTWPSPKFRSQAMLASTADSGTLSSFTFRVMAKQAVSIKLRLDTFLATQIAADLAAASASAAAAARTQDVSRAKIQASIAAGLVLVNGQPAAKASQQLKAGDCVVCRLQPPPPMQALPEAIPLDIKYEDDHVIVVNKPSGMVVHVAPGHHHGTLVNALLHHCALPALDLDSSLDLDPDLGTGSASAPDSGGGGVSGGRENYLYDNADDDGDDDDDFDGGDGDLDDVHGPDGDDWRRTLAVTNSASFKASSSAGKGSSSRGISSSSSNLTVAGSGDAQMSSSSRSSSGPITSIGTSSSSSCSTSSLSSSSCLRPGIVHRLDKGTSGLLVVAKTEVALTRLQAQFKARTVDRLYDSITVGCPVQPNGRVETNICRDPRDRKRMAAAPYGSGRGRTAGSNYTVMAPLAGGGAALVRWKLDTGRTHQIRVHAKYIGHPLLGDDTYGGTAPAALAAVSRGSSLDSLSSLEVTQVRQVVEQLGRPALHARTLGFTHPVTGARLSFEQPVPEDFLRALRGLGMEAAYG